MFDDCDAEENIYEEVASPLVSRLVQGYNATLVAYGQSGSGKSTSLNGMKDDELTQTQQTVDQTPRLSSPNSANDVGMTVRIASEIFRLIHESPEENEFTVRVSFMEIYLESITDLLSPTNRFLKVTRSDITDENLSKESTCGVVEGLTEVCCVRASDVISLLQRGLALQAINGRRKEMKNVKSNTIFRITIEQKNLVNERKKKSTFLVVNTAGTGLNRTSESTRVLDSHSRQLEKKLLDCSHSALNEVVTTLEKGSLYSSKTEQLAIFRKSKLTTMLMDSLGGNCFTTFLLTASPASFNINATLATARFGRRLNRLTNYPKVNITPSPKEFRHELEQTKKKTSELVALLNRASAEIDEAKSEDCIPFLVSNSWMKLTKMCDSYNNFFVEDDATEENSSSVATVDEDLRLANEKIEVLQKTLSDVISSRDTTQTSLDKLEEECLLLRHENQRMLQAKTKNATDLIDARSQIQSLNQRNTEMQHNLRTSRFRENESVVFLRHYRRFYRRLLESVHAQGSGNMNSILTMHMSGAPDLEELVDLDKMLMDSGLLEDNEVGGDSESGPYIPSKEALIRSSTQSAKMTSPTLHQLNVARNALNKSLEDTKSTHSLNENTSTSSASVHSESYPTASGRDLQQILDSSSAVSIVSNKSAVTNKQNASRVQSISAHGNDTERQQIIQRSPAGQLSQKRIDELEGEVVLMAKRCIELQTSLNDAESKLESLSLSKRVKKKLQNSEDNRTLKKNLEKKGADLEAVIWKMNELHLINKTYDDKLSNREQHIAYLEDTLSSLQEKNLRMVTIHMENEKRLRGEMERMNKTIDSLSAKMWQQDGDRDVLESRIIIPFQNVVGYGSGNETVERFSLNDDSSDEGGLGSDVVKNYMSMRNTSSFSLEEDATVGLTATTIDGDPINKNENETKLKISIEDMYRGGKDDDSYIPIRFTPKRGRLVRSATLRDQHYELTEARQDENIDVKYIQRQLKNLDALTKSWEVRQKGEVQLNQ